MSAPWTSVNALLNKEVQTLAADSDKVAVSHVWKMSSKMAHDGLRIFVGVGAKTGANASNAILQTRLADEEWQDVKTQALTTNTDVYINANPRISGDEDYFPLGTQCRLVVTTGASTTQVINKVRVSTE